MTHKNIIDYCNYLINKDQIADPISPEEYGAIIPVVNVEVYNREKKRLMEMAGHSHIKFVELLRDSYLQDVKRESEDGGSSSFPLPLGCDYLLSAMVIKGNYSVKVNLVSESQAYEMNNGLVDGGDAVYGYQVGKTVKLSDHADVIWMVYLTIPETPVFDYYIDSNHNFQYLPVGAEVLQGPPFNLWNVKVGNNVIATNIEYPQFEYTSISREFQWKDSLITTIVNLIFEKMGINIREQIPIQVSQMKKQEVE